ncbi:phosphopantetheine-binding protein [Myxococcus sp. MxC21-1]|uniref:phosphopantetheine-binding protein n=1 Tax=Myxococcus sp. MxC21-1 TaxID=3041439 RepID=UPI0029316334|nr:phosphopantetheine-binding protein [Myxococcus sp. MxC21-1]WNZ59306.1 phosphopantetheine-binding protein [Myxococcus sp. MxC21-1]
MVPAAIVRLDAFPYGSSGKVDRRALPPPPSSTEGEAPRTKTEAVLAALWADVLQLDRVGIDQGFFELGGHSLLAMQVLARLRSTFGVELPLRALFEEGTIAALAARIDQAGNTPAPAPLRRSSAPAAAHHRHCPSRSSGCGCWPRWSPAAPPTTCPGRSTSLEGSTPPRSSSP